MRMKHVKDVPNMIADIHKVGPLTYPRNSGGIMEVSSKQGYKAAGAAWSNDIMCNDKVQAHLHGIHRGYEKATHGATLQGLKMHKS